MRAVIQRVNEASVSIDQQIISEISAGLLVFLGIEDSDNDEDVEWLCGKISRLRIFPDAEGVMNLSVMDIQGEVLVISQFTLHASTKKGNRPSYIKAAPPLFAIPMYEKFIGTMETLIGKPISKGEFGGMMEISLVNSGPVTIIIDTKNKV